MAKARPKKTNKVRLYALLKLSPLILIGLFVLYLICNAMYNSYLDQKDKQRWEAVKADMQTLHNELKQETGLDWEFRTSCHTGSVKFEKPNLTCDVGTRNEIKVDSVVRTKQIIDDINDVLTSNSNFEFRRDTKIAFYPNLSKGLDEDSGYLPGFGGGVFENKKSSAMNCGVSYRIVHDEKQKKQALLVSYFHCDDYTRQLFFPERD